MKKLLIGWLFVLFGMLSVQAQTLGPIGGGGSGGGGSGGATPVGTLTSGDVICGAGTTSLQDCANNNPIYAVLPTPLNITAAVNFGAGTDNGPANSFIFTNSTAAGICSNTTLCNLYNLTIADNVDASASANGLYAFHFTDTVGTSSKKGRSAAWFDMNFSGVPAAPGGNYVAVTGWTNNNQNMAGVGSMFGANFKASAGASSNINQLIGTEWNIHALAGATYKDFVLGQFVVESTHAQAGTEMNAGVLISSQANTTPMPDALFQDGAFQGFPASTTNTTIFRCYPHANTGSCPTILAGINLTKYTITGNAFASNGFSVNGSGVITAAGCSGCSVGGGSPPPADYVTNTWYVPQNGLIASVGNTGVVAATIYCTFGGVNPSVTIKNLQFRVTVGVAGNGQMAIYSVSGNTLTLVDSTGSQSTASPGNFTQALLNTTDTLTAGTLYAWCVNNSATPTYATYAATGLGAAQFIGGSAANTVVGTPVLGKSIAQTFGTWPGTITLSGMADVITLIPPQMGFQVN